MIQAYPAQFDTTQPPTLQRTQVALRLLAMVLIAALGASLGRLLGLVYLVLPLVAAALVSRHGADTFARDDAPKITRLLHTLLAFLAWLAFLTDRFPTSADAVDVKFTVETSGRPTTSSTLLRLATSLPMAFLGAIVWSLLGLVGFVAAISVLVNGTVPRELYDVQRGALRWISRVLAYHASLVEAYPPISFDTEPDLLPSH